VGDIHYHNASLPRTILTVPAAKFGREQIRATVENRYRHTDFAPVRGELPVKPSRASLSGGAPKGVQPPREIVSRPVVSTRTPRERMPALQDEAPRARTPAVPESRYVIPPARRAEDARTLPRPARGPAAGPERVPPPRPPRYEEVRKSMPPPPAVIPREQATPRGQATTREQSTQQREIRTVPRPAQPAVVAPPASRPAVPGSVQAPRARTEAAPQRGEAREGARERPLPGQPASQTYRGRDRENRDAR
jgi:hypothetical protein